MDTNGRVVTRHVRKNGSPSPQMTSAPTPPKIMTESQRSLATIVHSAILDYAQMRSYSPVHDVTVNADERSIREYFAGLHDDIAHECLMQALSSETDRGYVSLLLSAVHRRETPNLLSDMTFLYDPELEMASTEEWNPEFAIAGNHSYLRAVVTGIRSYEDWGFILPERFSIAPSDKQEAITALYETTEFICMNSEDYEGIAFKRKPSGENESISLSDRLLFETVVKHHSRLQEILSVLETRGNNGELLSDYFASHPPLRNGIL